MRSINENGGSGMRSVVVVGLVILAASCGKKEPEFARQTRELADRYCACRDDDCRIKVRHDVDVARVKPGDRKDVSLGDAMKAAPHWDRYLACVAKNSPIVAAAEAMAAAVCACKDVECAMAAVKEGAANLEKFMNAAGPKAEADAIKAAGEKSAECFKKLTAAGASAPPQDATPPAPPLP